MPSLVDPLRNSDIVVTWEEPEGFAEAGTGGLSTSLPGDMARLRTGGAPAPISANLLKLDRRARQVCTDARSENTFLKLEGPGDRWRPLSSFSTGDGAGTGGACVARGICNVCADRGDRMGRRPGEDPGTEGDETEWGREGSSCPGFASAGDSSKMDISTLYCRN
mmetsp:Transcript_52687/g.103022  ORF Transcript_52687/g.103022 Transcript_52687/m.103022 type:complete len:165 (-) Transcript_52687:130-624(-)